MRRRLQISRQLSHSLVRSPNPVAMWTTGRTINFIVPTWQGGRFRGWRRSFTVRSVECICWVGVVDIAILSFALACDSSMADGTRRSEWRAGAGAVPGQRQQSPGHQRCPDPGQRAAGQQSTALKPPSREKPPTGACNACRSHAWQRPEGYMAL